MRTHKIICNNGLALLLTDEQVEAVFRYRERQYRLLDAESHLLDNIDEEMTDEMFKDTYGITLTEACDKESVNCILNDLVERFADKQDCNLAENDVWRDVVAEYLSELKEN